MATYKLVDSDKLDAAMTATADAIRAKTGSTDPIPWDKETGMADSVPAVYEAGEAAGVEAGRKAEYDAFWDVFQQEGKRTSYESAFANGWNDETFRPKYDLICEYGARMFQNSRIVELKDILDKSNVVLDVSSCDTILQMFQGANCRHIPKIDASNATSANYAFAGYGGGAEIIDKLIVSEKCSFYLTFYESRKLREITFEGTIGAAIDLHWSPLSKASILSTITALSDSTSGLTASFSLTAVNTAFETSPAAADGSTSEEWTALIATKPNWTISLA